MPTVPLISLNSVPGLKLKVLLGSRESVVLGPKKFEGRDHERLSSTVLRRPNVHSHQDQSALAIDRRSTVTARCIPPPVDHQFIYPTHDNWRTSFVGITQAG